MSRPPRDLEFDTLVAQIRLDMDGHEHSKEAAERFAEFVKQTEPAEVKRKREAAHKKGMR